MMEVPATEFTKRFAQYRRAAQRGPVAVTHHGQVTEVLVSVQDYEDYLRLKRREPRALRATELGPEWVEALESALVEQACTAV